MSTLPIPDALDDLRQQLPDRDRHIADLTKELACWKMAPQSIAASHRDAAEELLTLLRDCQIALNDCLHTYAHELCDAAQVKESARRIFEQGETSPTSPSYSTD